MNSVLNILTAKNIFFVLLLMIAFILLFLAPNAAVNVDERLHYPHAKKVVNWYFTKGADKSCLDTPQTNLKYYGQSVDNITALINRIFDIRNEYLTRHYTGAFMFWLLLLFSGFLAKQISGSYITAIIAVLSLMLTPRLFGQAFGNLKDIPFATGYTAGILMIIKFLSELPRPRWQTVILLGLAIAFTVSVRAGGFILFVYLGICLFFYWSWKPFELKQIVSTKPVFVRLLGQGIAILLIGYFAGLLFWPFALQNIFLHPWESLGVMEHYKVSIRQVFEGNFTWSTDLPWYYLPKWLLISTPEFILFGAFVFIVLFVRSIFNKSTHSQQLYFESFLFFSLIFPILYVITINSNLYSGIRQMLFILPPLVILVSVSITKLIKANLSGFIKYPIPVFFFVLMILPLKHQAATFPVDYVYFNRISGGNEKAWANYEYDFYFHALKEPVDYLKNLLKESDEVTVAINCNLSNYFENTPNLKYQYTRYLERSSADWDYGIFGINYIHPYLLKNDLWQSSETLKTFYHKRNPVAVLVKRKEENDWNGITAINQGNLEKGEALLKKAVDNDPNNVWLFVNLAKISLKKGDDLSFNSYVKSGRKIYPEYEPFFLLEAEKLFKEEKYKQSYEKINELLNINPRYKPAVGLYKDLQDILKLNG